MKKIISLILSLTIGIFTTFSVAAGAKTSGKYKYNILKNNTASITEYTGNEENLTIPETLGGYTVTKLDSSAFEDKSKLKTVTLNDNLVEIGDSCFMDCEKLSKINFNRKLKKIGENAFEFTNIKSVDLPNSLTYLNGFNFTKLKEITIPSSVKTIGDWAFYECPLTKVELNKGLESIGAEAFCYCENLKEIKFPSTLKKVGSDAFSQTGITEITIPEKLTNINIKKTDFGVFSEKLKKITVSKKNKKYSSKSGILYNKKKTQLLYYPPKRGKKTFKTPKSVKTICQGAFNSAKIKKVIVTGNVKKVEKEAFAHSKTPTVIFKKGVKTIENYAFYFSEVNKVTLPNGLKKIASQTFSASRLSKVNIPKSVKKIGAEAFFGTDLKTITVPSTVKKIGKYAIGILYGECGSYGGVNKNTIIRCKYNSAAYKYAKKYKVKYKLM